VPTLERLIAARHEVCQACEVCIVVTQPDRRRGRGRKTSPSPVAKVAEAAGIALLRPERVGAPDCVAALDEQAPDLGVVVAFGQFLPRSVRELPRLGYLINAHASILPRHRGAAPIAHAILAGDEKTGISVMRVEREMDAGAVALVRETPIGEDDDSGSLTGRLGEIAAGAILEAIGRIADGSVTWTDQDAARATLAPKIGPEDARLDFREDAASLARRVRAMSPSPGASTTHGGEPLRILAANSEAGAAGVAPGTVRRDTAGTLRVATRDGWLVPTRVQRAGGKGLEIDAYLRGRSIDDGSVLGPIEVRGTS
jgi:methionyl-tRNA formyltransferase